MVKQSVEDTSDVGNECIYRNPPLLLLPLQVCSCVALKWRSSAKLIMLKASVAKSAARWRRVSWRLEEERGGRHFVLPLSG